MKIDNDGYGECGKVAIEERKTINQYHFEI